MTESAEPIAARRSVLRLAGGVSALALLAGCESLGLGEAQPAQPARPPGPPPRPEPSADVRLLNAALALKHEAVVAYQIALENRALRRPLQPVAQLFQSQHRQHRDALGTIVVRLGGTAVEPRPREDYASGLNAAGLRTEADILRLLARIEQNSITGMVALLPDFQDRALTRLVGAVIADDTMHWTALKGLLRETLPVEAFSFGPAQPPAPATPPGS